MLVISTREFRANQGKYLGMAAQGEEVVLRSRDNGSFKLTPVDDGGTLMTDEEFKETIERARREAKEGKCRTLDSKEDIQAYLDSL